MRILVVVSGQKWLGGLTIHTALLCRELECLGHTIAVVSIGADAVVDQFRHERVRHANGLAGGVPHERVRHGKGATSRPPGDTAEAASADGAPEAEYVFRYEVVADAARYLPPGSPALRRLLAPLARAGMAIVAPPRATGRAPLTQARGAAASFARGVTAALDAGLSGGAAEAPFLSRLLLHTDQEDLERLNEIRRRFQPDVEYACDLALVPMMAKLEDRGIPLVAAAQGFEIVQRRGVGLARALAQARTRLDLVLSGSEANLVENFAQLGAIADGSVPAHAIPYGVALDGGWEMSRRDAVRRLQDLERHLSRDQWGTGGLWGEGGQPGGTQPFVVTTLSRIDVEKGTDLVLHAVSVLRRQGVPVRLWIAGNAMPGSSFLDVLRNKIRLMDLEDAVNLIGTIRDQQDKVALLRASHTFAAGFIRSEPFGLVYTEAFASQLPVVAPDTGAAPELMAYVGDSSMLYPMNDTGALADRLLELYQAPEHRRCLAEAQHRAFLRRFNATEMARATASEFEEARRRRGGRRHEG